jgi:GTPase-associated protein 1, N-terminal domain type 2
VTTPQLVYGSSDGIPGRSSGGWGVLHRTPDLSPDLEARLLTLVSDDMPSTVPDFPSRQQLADRPVRFRVFPEASGSRAAVCRSVEAGLDQTRRPGNVFTHAAVVTCRENVRAMDYWFSSAWLSPFGAEQVRLAVPPGEVPVEGFGFGAVSLRFRQNHELIRALPWMIDALCHCVFTGRQIVIVDPRPANSALWLGLLAWALAERTASGLAVAIYEDRRSAAMMLDRGAHVVTVADQAVASSLGPRVTVLDPSWEPDDTQAAITGMWLLPSGATIPRTEWARLLVDLVWASPMMAQRAFVAREGLVEGLRTLHALSPSSETELATLHLAFISESDSGTLNQQVVRDHLKVFPPAALTHPVVRRLAEEAGMVERPGVVQSAASITLTPRPNVAVNHTPEAPMPADSPSVAPVTGGSSLGDFHFPTPRSATLAASFLGSAGLGTEQIGTCAGWASAFTHGDAALRLPLLHAAAHLLDAPLDGDSLRLLFDAVTLDETFEVLAPGLLVLACRSHLAYPPNSHLVGPAWVALSNYVAQQDAEDLAYLSFHFGPILEGLEWGTVWSRQELEILSEQETASVWTMENRLSTPLALMVLDQIAQTQRERPMVGRRGRQ